MCRGERAYRRSRQADRWEQVQRHEPAGTDTRDERADRFAGVGGWACGVSCVHILFEGVGVVGGGEFFADYS